MEVNTAVQVAESLGANLILDDAMNLYTLHFGNSECFLKPTEIERVSVDSFKAFLISLIQNEIEQISRYGGPTRH